MRLRVWVKILHEIITWQKQIILSQVSRFMADHESQNSKMNNNYLLLYFIIVYGCFLLKMPIWRELLVASLTKLLALFLIRNGCPNY
jgi:hypothetical protein